MEEHASNRWTDYSLVCIIRRIVKEIPTVIAAGLIAAMLTVAYLQVFISRSIPPAQPLPWA